MLMRPLFLVLVIDPQGRVTKARVGNQTRQVYKGTNVKVVGGRVRILPKNTLLIDWRPDYIQAKCNGKKSTIRHPTTQEVLPPDEFIVIHQTLDKPKIEKIGYGINTAIATKACGHYLIDTDGFVVKMAAEGINTNHAGGVDGDHWDVFTSRISTNKKPLRNIASFNSISVGIEHVRSRPRNAKLGRTKIPKEQIVASHALIHRLWSGRQVSQNRIVTRNQIAITSHNQLGMKHSCPGSGYEWKPLENAGLALQTVFGHVYTPAEMPIVRYLEARKRQGKPEIIDAAANGSGAVKILKKALAEIGYLIPTIDDTYDSVFENALFAFLMRHYSGKANEKRLRVVQNGKSGAPITKKHLVDTVLEVKRIKRLNKTTKVP